MKMESEGKIGDSATLCVVKELAFGSVSESGIRLWDWYQMFSGIRSASQKYGCKRIPGVINSTKLYDEVTSRESSDGIEMLGKRRTG